VGDRFTWKMRLDSIGLAHPSIPDYVLANASFSIVPPSFDIRSFPSASYVIIASTWTSPVLRYEYTYAKSRAWEKLGNFLGEATHMQLHKMKPQDRPERYFVMPNLSDDDLYRYFTLEFDVPEGWDYFDDEVPKMIDHWLKEEYGDDYEN
jgi:hypothetical protein